MEYKLLLYVLYKICKIKSKSNPPFSLQHLNETLIYLSVTWGDLNGIPFRYGWMIVIEPSTGLIAITWPWYVPKVSPQSRETIQPMNLSILYKSQNRVYLFCNALPIVNFSPKQLSPQNKLIANTKNCCNLQNPAKHQTTTALTGPLPKFWPTKDFMATELQSDLVWLYSISTQKPKELSSSMPM